MNTLILAAGFGKRLYPLTIDIPKALIEINGKPTIEHLIERIKEIKEIEQIYILSNNKFYINFIEWLKNFQSKDNHSIKIKILSNGINTEAEQRGAIADLIYALKTINCTDLFVLASDNLFSFSLKELYDLSLTKNSSTIAIRIIENKELIKKYSCVMLDKNYRIISFEEKPREPKSNICSTACYFFIKKDLNKIKLHAFNNFDHLGEIINFLHKKSRVFGKLSGGYWFDIGSVEELEKAREYLKNNT